MTGGAVAARAGEVVIGIIIISNRCGMAEIA